MDTTDSKLTEKIQVLLSKKDVRNLYDIMLGKAIKIGRPNVPLSTFIRAVIREFIKQETINQASFVDEKIQELKK